MLIGRRGFIGGLTAAFFCAPAIVRASSLMPVKQMIVPVWEPLFEGMLRGGFIEAGVCLEQPWEHEVRVRGRDWTITGVDLDKGVGQEFERPLKFPSDVGARWERLKARQVGPVRPLTYDGDWHDMGGKRRVYS